MYKDKRIQREMQDFVLALYPKRIMLICPLFEVLLFAGPVLRFHVKLGEIDSHNIIQDAKRLGWGPHEGFL